MKREVLTFIIAAWVACAALQASAQVRGYLVGIDVNCPSGLGE